MKGIIVLNGEKYSGEIDTADSYVLAVDGGYAFCAERGIKVDGSVGDFDSLPFIPENAVVYPEEKNLTDGEIAVRKMEELGIKNVEIYCGGGKRDDHYLGNLGLLLLAESLGITAVFITDYTKIRVIDGTYSFNEKIGTTVSVIPSGKGVIYTAVEGLKYPANELYLKPFDNRAVSNVTTENRVTVYVNGKAFLIVVKN